MVESDFIDHSHDGFWNESPEELAEYGVVTDTYDPDQMFVEWLQSVTPEGKTVVYHGNQYQGTGTGRTSSPVDKIKPIALEGTDASQSTEGKPITLENSNASQNAEGINKSETKDVSTLEKTETGNEVSSDKIDDVDSNEWVTHLNDESDTKDKVNTKNTDTTKGEKSQYPNGMSREEFNAMYEFAAGMTGRGGNQQLNDDGEPMGYWGDFKTIPTTIDDIQYEISKRQAQYETLESRGTLSETQANHIQAVIKENEDRLSAAQEQLDSLNAFIDNYASLYTPIEKEEQQKELLSVKANAAYEQAREEQFAAWDNLTQAIREAGMDNLSAEGVLNMEGNKFELPKEDKNYATKAAEAIVKNFTNKDFEGGDFTIPVNPSAKEYGNYLVKIAPALGIGVSNFKVGIISPKGEWVAKGSVVAPSGWSNGVWDLKCKDGKTISGESTSAFTSSITKAFSNAAIADYENSQSTSSIPENVKTAAQAVLAAEKNFADKGKELEEARKADTKSIHSAATEAKQSIMDKYDRGELNPYQAAVALSNIHDSMLDFKYNSITSNINYDDFKDKTAPVAGVTDGTVGISDFIDDVSPINPATSLNAMKDRLNKIDVSNIKSKEQAETLSNDLSNYLSDFSVEANNELQTLVTSLLETGGQLQNVRNDPKFKKLSTEIYTLAQAVYDKTSAVEEYTRKYFGDIDISSRRAIKKNIEEISNKIAEMQGAEHIVHTDDKGRTSFILNKEEVKALANYGKTIDATKDAAIALMKSAAFNGAENVTGDKYSEAWKRKIAADDVMDENSTKDILKDLASGFFGTKGSDKFTIGDFIASGTRGMIGVVTTGIGISIVPYNPILGTMFIYAGVNSVGREILKFGTDNARSFTTNEEAMFGQKYDKGKQVWNEIYNRSFEKANYGDPKSIATWTAAVGIVGGLVEMMAGGVGIVDGIVRIKQNVEILANRGLSGNIDTTIQNIYNLGENIITWSNMNLNINDYMKNPDQALIYKGKNVNTLTDDDISIKPNYATYGTATSDDSSVLDNKYSGYTEQAKNSNLAKDYNAGMEKNVNEAVSDKYVKVFKVMLDKEPDYIRKVLIAIPKNHFEMRW